MTPSLEAELLGPRTEMALRYIVENDLNRIVILHDFERWTRFTEINDVEGFKIFQVA